METKLTPAQHAARVRAGTNPNSTNAQGRARDAEIIRLALLGPIWKRALLKIGLFKTYQTCDRRIFILEDDDNKKLLHSYRAKIGDGRKSTVWFNRNIAEQNIQHETDVMKVFFAYYPCIEAKTGTHVDQRWRSDMDAVISGLSYKVELDRNTEGFPQVKRRLALYDTCPDPVLFVTTSEKRKKDCMHETRNSRIYFCTLEALLDNPWSDIWVNCLGEIEAVVPLEEGAENLRGSASPSCPTYTSSLPARRQS